MDVYPHMVINDDLDVCYDAFQPMLGPVYDTSIVRSPTSDATARLLADPVVRAVERENVIHLKYWEVHHIVPRRQSDIPRLRCGGLLQRPILSPGSTMCRPHCLLTVRCV